MNRPLITRLALLTLTLAGALTVPAASSTAAGPRGDGLTPAPRACGLPGTLIPAEIAETGCTPPAGTADSPAPSSAPGPADCLIPDVDDKCEAWAAVYDGPAGDFDSAGDGGLGAKRVITTSLDDSTVFVAGTSLVAAQDFELVTAAYDSQTGAQRWVSRYEGTENNPAPVAQAMALSPDGDTVYSLAIAYPDCEAAVVAHDASTGAERWRTTYANPDLGCTVPADMAASELPGGSERLYVSGYNFDGSISPEAWILAFDIAEDSSLAGTAWEVHAPGPNGEGMLASSLGVSADGSKVYQGAGLNGPGLFQRTTLSIFAYEAEDGSPLWTTHHRPQSEDAVNGVQEIVTVGDQVLATGLEDGPSGLALRTLALDGRTGEIQWSQILAGANVFALGNGSITAGGDRVFVTAHVTGGDTQGHGWSIAVYDRATGTEAWSIEALDPGPRMVSYFGFYPSVATTPMGDKVIVTGPRGQHHVTAAVTVAYDAASGGQLWSARWLHGSAYPATITAARNGQRVFVTGTTNEVEAWPAASPVTSSDMMTVAYAV